MHKEKRKGEIAQEKQTFGVEGSECNAMERRKRSPAERDIFSRNIPPDEFIRRALYLFRFYLDVET